jgi:hypothetical protein
MLRIGRYHFTVTDSILMGDLCRPSRVSGSAAFFQKRLDWLMLAVPAAFAIRFVPAWSSGADHSDGLSMSPQMRAKAGGRNPLSRSSRSQFSVVFGAQ